MNDLSGRTSPVANAPGSPGLKLDSALADGVGQRLEPAVVLVVAAVEGRPGDAGRLGRLGQLLADLDRRLDVAAVGPALLEAGRGAQRLAAEVVDHLGVDVLRRAVDAQARPLRRADDLLADAPALALAGHGESLLCLHVTIPSQAA